MTNLKREMKIVISPNGRDNCDIRRSVCVYGVHILHYNLNIENILIRHDFQYS